MHTQDTAETQEAAATRPKPLRRNRDYLLLWSGQAISSAGSSASELALPLLILSITHSPAQAGLAGALRSLAYLLLGLPAGALIDRWDRKRMMIFCDAGRALTLGSIPLALALNHLTMAQLYLVSLIEGTLYVFFSLAESAALPRVVAREQLPAATAQNEATSGVVTLVGPSLGGALFGVAKALPFLADAISYAASVCSLFWIRLPFQEERQPQTSPSLRADIWEGLVWLWRQPVVRAIGLLHSGLILSGSGMTLLMLVIAERQQASPFAIGLMFGVSGLGSILGTLLGSQAHKRLRLGQIMVAAFWLFALLWPLYAIAPSPLALGTILAAFWVVDETYDVAQLSYRLALIPDALRGRVNGALRLAFFSCETLGLALTGLLLQQIGVLPTLLCFEGAWVLLAVATTLNRSLRTASPLSGL
ncbi:MAG TPA: MFS transporter [Ktedonobacterales bacterium]|nr:MFS transporter [Ktedonobacterales bacterium]